MPKMDGILVSNLCLILGESVTCYVCDGCSMDITWDGELVECGSEPGHIDHVSLMERIRHQFAMCTTMTQMSECPKMYPFGPQISPTVQKLHLYSVLRSGTFRDF